MELFKIERFGVEYNEDWKKHQSDALQLNIEKRRKKQLEKSSRVKKHVESDNVNIKKKRKHNDFQENEEGTPEKKKKKSKKMKDMEIEIVEETSKITTMLDAKEKATKKKKKKSKKTKDLEIEIVDETSKITTMLDAKEKAIKEKKKKSKKNIESDNEDNDPNNVNIEIENGITEKTKKSDNNSDDSVYEHINTIEAVENGVNNDNVNVLNGNKKSDEPIFPILEKQKHHKRSAVRRALPRWLNESNSIPLQYENNQISLDDCQSFLSENTVGNLKKMDITNLFPVQSKIVPHVMKMYKRYNPCFPKRSVCVQSPTGSGKTLSYVLPIVEILSKNVIRELYCLVIVPSKELAMQVKTVFDHFVIGTNLKVGLFSGGKTIAAEQDRVVVKRKSGYESLVDIIVSTSGRLLDHLKRTEGFTLKHLKFLVIDEADKMLTSENDSWVPFVNNSIHSGDCKKTYPLTANNFSKPAHYVHKLLFSATLTQSPEKIAPLELYNPVLFTTKGGGEKTELTTVEHEGEDGQQYVIPENLIQKMTVVQYSQKPLVLIHVICTMEYKRVLCFTNSLDSTHRLFLLLKEMDKFSVAEFSSRLTEQQRKGILRDFRENKISVLIATDAMSRGMDIDHVDLVVNYDVPMSAKRYVHRAGRTARAGTKGETLTILVRKQSRKFTNMISKWLSGGKPVENISISKESFSVYEEKYEHALDELKNHVFEEKKSK